MEDSESLCECLKSLATDSNKHRAKNDRRKQRSIFREVLHYIEVCFIAAKVAFDTNDFTSVSELVTEQLVFHFQVVDISHGSVKLLV